MKLLRRIIVASASIAILFTALMGFAHTRAGRPLLSFMLPMIRPLMVTFGASSAVCPMGYDHRATLQDRQRMRDRMASARAGEPFAPTRTALDFVIGKTTRQDAENWAKAQGGSCHGLRSAYESQCDGKFFHSDSSTLWLEYDSEEHLISMRGVENYPSVDDALIFFKQLKSSLHGHVVQKGQAQAATLKSGLLHQASVISDYRNYSVVARVTNMGANFTVTHDFLGF
jgi:hypothetical protein